MGFTPKQYVFIFGMLITGTINTISKKLQLDCTARGYFNHSASDARTVHNFNKPWFQTLLMFIGEVLCLFAFLVVRYRKRKRLLNEGIYHRTDVDPSRPGIINTPIFNWWFLLPACCDLLGTTLAGIGLLFVDASIWQMMRGSLIIFAGILSILFLKRRLFGFHWCGMLFTVLGLALVGTKSVFSGRSLNHTAAQSVIGILLVLAGAFISACQMIVEEVFLKKRGFHPLQAVGMEGLFGTLLMVVIALPAVHYIPGGDLNGAYENIADALYQIGDSPLLLVNCILYILSIAFFNYFGLSITRYLSAVHRTLIDALRTTFVWLISLILFYSTNGRFGEPFSTAWGMIQIDGFSLLIIGTLVYNKVIDLTFIPCCAGPPSEVLTETADELTTEEAIPDEEYAEITNKNNSNAERVPVAPTSQAYYVLDDER